MSRTKDKKGIARCDGVRAMGVGRIFSGGGGFFQGVGGNSLFSHEVNARVSSRWRQQW